MRIAAIDVGSNSIHMIVCRIRPDRSFDVIEREKDMIRLGAGGLGRRPLPTATLATALDTLARFRRLAASRGAEEIVAAATSAVREAPNGGDLVAAAQRDLGLRVRVISGTEEARLIHQAAAYAVGVRRPSVVVDIGGGSTEITLGTATRVDLGGSLKLGVLRLTGRFGRSDPMSDDDERRLVRHVRREAGPLLRQIARRGFDRVVGSSGTMLSIGALAAGRRSSDEVRNLRVEARAISRLRRRLVGLTLDDRLQLPGLDPRRADLAAVGAVLVDVLLETLRADEITLSDFALREGLVLDYIRRNRALIRTAARYPDVRRRSVVELAGRCQAVPAHGEHVARLALRLFDQTADRHGLGAREREWLEYAALLHDIGHHIGYERHHKHSDYLIRHGGLRGFEPDEVMAIALTARYHRQGRPRKSHEGFGDLPRGRRKAVRILGALLRVAENLDRSHARAVGDVEVEAEAARLRVRLRAEGDAELELWAAERQAEVLGRALDVAVDFELAAGIPAPRKGRSSDHAEHARHAPHVSGAPVRRRGDRRVRQDDAARSRRQVAHGRRQPGVRD